jgi:hypothetical protein
MVTIKKQQATAIVVIVVSGDNVFNKTPVDDANSSLLSKLLISSSPICDNCCSAPIGIRLLPAGDELMQPPIV